MNKTNVGFRIVLVFLVLVFGFCVYFVLRETVFTERTIVGSIEEIKQDKHFGHLYSFSVKTNDKKIYNFRFIGVDECPLKKGQNVEVTFDKDRVWYTLGGTTDSDGSANIGCVSMGYLVVKSCKLIVYPDR